MKRVTNLPQFVLGAAFGWGIPMGYAAVSESLPLSCWLLLLANICWTVAYDTLYAMVDRDDDLKIGIKSTAILFGRYDKLIVGLLQFVTLLLLVWVGYLAQLGGRFTGRCCWRARCSFTSRNRSPAASAKPASRPSCRTTMSGWWYLSALR